MQVEERSKAGWADLEKGDLVGLELWVPTTSVSSVEGNPSPELDEHHWSDVGGNKDIPSCSTVSACCVGGRR